MVGDNGVCNADGDGDGDGDGGGGDILPCVGQRSRRVHDRLIRLSPYPLPALDRTPLVS